MKSTLFCVFALSCATFFSSCSWLCNIFCGNCNGGYIPPDPISYLDKQVIAYNPSIALTEYLKNKGFSKIDSCKCKDSIELWGGPKPAEFIVGLIGGGCVKCDGDIGNLSDAESVSFNFNLDFGKESLIVTDSPPIRKPQIIDKNKLNIKPDLINKTRSHLIPQATGFIDIGIVDSGEGENVNFLSGKYWSKSLSDLSCLMNSGAHGIDLTDKITREPSDSMGHGNAVNCIALGYNVGIVPNARVINAKFLNSTVPGNLFKALCGSYFALEHGSRIINFSWGYLGERTQMPKIMLPFLKKANENGVIIVAGAGNDSKDIDSKAFWPSSFNSYYPNIISVGGLDSTTTDLWVGSNYGTGIDIYAQAEKVKTISLTNKLAKGNGTSFAAPRIVFELSKIMYDNPTASPYEVKNILLTTRTSNAVSTVRSNLNYKKLN